MRLPERRVRKANLLDLICELIEEPRPKISAGFLDPHGDATERLIEIGLLQPGTAPRTIACRACDEDHAADPEFDRATGRYFHFCPVAGRVAIDSCDLETLEIRPRALVDLLLAAFPVVPAIGQELVTEKVWHLGEAVIGGTSLTLMFACRIGNQRALGELAKTVEAIPVTEIGMIVTSSPLPDARLLLPNRYRLVGLRDIAMVQKERLVINQARVAAHVRMTRGNSLRLHAGGRPSDRTLIVADHDHRRDRGEPFVSIAAEAWVIISEWATAHSDRPAPGFSTVRRHLAKHRSSGS